MALISTAYYRNIRLSGKPEYSGYLSGKLKTETRMNTLRYQPGVRTYAKCEARHVRAPRSPLWMESKSIEDTQFGIRLT